LDAIETVLSKGPGETPGLFYLKAGFDSRYYLKGSKAILMWS
jgi:hypothetical protein